MPRTPISHSGSSGGDVDPADIGDWIGKFDSLPHDAPTSGAERANLRRCWYEIRDRGAATGRPLRADCFEGTITDIYRGTGEWYDTLIRPYLPFLPHITPPEDAGDTWEFVDDPDHDRPAAVTDADPGEQFIRDAVTALRDDVLPEPDNVAPHLQHRNRTGVRRAYAELIETGYAGRGTLREHYATSPAPADGIYADAGRWFRIVGAPALRRLPGVDAPPVVGGEWRYVGIDADRV